MKPDFVNMAAIRLVDRFRDTDALNVYREYLHTQWSSPAIHRAYQITALKKLIAHAYTNTVYYRELFDREGLTPADFTALDSLSMLPILEKDTIRARQEDFIAKNMGQFSPKKKATGGSTGTPLSYFMDRDARSSHWATMYRQWHTGGWRPGTMLVYLGGSSIFPAANDVKRWVYVRLNNWKALSSFDMTEENMAKWLHMIRESKIRYMHSYASSANLLATFAEANGMRDFQLKSVFTSAESLLPRHRETIERVFRCEVFDLYGANDGGGFAFECEEHLGLHAVSERAIMEVIDTRGDPVASGETGELITTDLLNYSMPFIRYRVGDMASKKPKDCPCGRGLPLFSPIQGRSHDFVLTKKGAKVHGEFFAHLLRNRQWVDQFSVVQEENGDIVLLIRTMSRELPDEAKEIQGVLKQKFEGSNVSLQPALEMPVASSGKHRFVINKMHHV